MPRLRQYAKMIFGHGFKLDVTFLLSGIKARQSVVIEVLDLKSDLQ